MPEVNPVNLIVAEIIRRLEKPRFEPFTIVMSDGKRIDVPTADHCTVTRLLHRISVEHDDLRIFDINPLHVTRFEAIKPAA